MSAVEPAPTTALALLADLHPETRQPDRIHAVLGWTDEGKRHYRSLTRLVDVVGCRDLDIADPSRADRPEQLCFDVDGLTGTRTTSSGRTWRTWSLASIPADLRHLGLEAVVGAVADQLGG